MESAEAVVQRYSIKEGVPRNFVKFLGKHLCQSLFSDKTSGRLLLKVPFIIVELFNLKMKLESCLMKINFSLEKGFCTCLTNSKHISH